MLKININISINLKKLNLGFTLIEIIIALLIASLVSMGLYQMFFQVSKTVLQISSVIELDTPLLPFYGQLEVDTSGMFMPTGTIKSYFKLNQENKYIKDIFYVDIKDKRNMTLSFITTSAIQSLNFDGSIKAVPFVKRVAYILQDNPEYPDRSKLIYRYSANDLSIENIIKPEFDLSYEIISTIKDFSLEFTLYEMIEVKEGENSEAKKPESKQIKLEKWVENEIFEKYKTLIPAYMTVKGTYTDASGNTEYPFNFSFKILAYRALKKEEFEQKKESAFAQTVSFIRNLSNNKNNDKNNNSNSPNNSSKK